MKKIILLTLLLFSITAKAETTPQISSEQMIAKNINNLLEKNHIPFLVGIVVSKLPTGKLVYQRNADLLFVPASNLKLFTATAALLYLGPNFHYQTKLLLNNANMSNETLNGDVYLKFSGDPDFTRNDLLNLILNLKNYNIQTINGEIYLDNSVFDGDSIGQGWAWDDLKACYASPNQALMIDKNCFDVIVSPAKVENQVAVLALKTEVPYNIDNKVITSFSKKDCSINVKVLKNNQYQLVGCIFKETPPQAISLAVKNPQEDAKIIIKNLLMQNNIRLNGEIKISQTPFSAKLVAQHDSKPTDELVKLMLKNSDNHIADSFSKTIGSLYSNSPGTWADGTKAIIDILQKRANIDLSETKMVDGSGLSFYNLITPLQLQQLLNYIYNSSMKDYIMNALPIAGVDGTLKGRMADNNTKGYVFAKTGTLNQVIALSGYAKNKRGQEYSFVIIFNNFSVHANKMKHLEDQLVKILVNS
ncbi:MAG: D-alanyl-D-alanine carboxypeptidase/D-alanyl-D-alanine-endopeptidase [Gammaproteobacteria bacterium]